MGKNSRDDLDTIEAMTNKRRRHAGKWSVDGVKLDKAFRSIDRQVDEEISAILLTKGYKRSRHQWRRLRNADARAV